MRKQRSLPDALWNGSIRRQSRRLEIGAASRLRGSEATFDEDAPGNTADVAATCYVEAYRRECDMRMGDRRQPL
jgi:hypothetical protein